MSIRSMLVLRAAQRWRWFAEYRHPEALRAYCLRRAAIMESEARRLAEADAAAVLS
jgi:hypothetical protein